MRSWKRLIFSLNFTRSAMTDFWTKNNVWGHCTPLNYRHSSYISLSCDLKFGSKSLHPLTQMHSIGWWSIGQIGPRGEKLWSRQRLYNKRSKGHITHLSNNGLLNNFDPSSFTESKTTQEAYVSKSCTSNFKYWSFTFNKKKHCFLKKFQRVQTFI